ncbi:hypothetical protein BC936DRAFT_144140 [Jimgerdemannia flammicorona]|uniref:Uncharacterized protein n=1 Tax=Jimgerdemannia flammicorona TaxID=994334 RepID=A0A432ZY18_9FUNG|nr:hypothetical protein BC936DRAFT_144140 [Jimgerdemannia flammicorona]
MLSGIVTPPLILGGAGTGHLNLSEDYRNYMISAALIICGFGSALQITRFKLWNTGYYLGTGLISVVGTSFTIIPLAESVVKSMYKNRAPNIVMEHKFVRRDGYSVIGSIHIVINSDSILARSSVLRTLNTASWIWRFNPIINVISNVVLVSH